MLVVPTLMSLMLMLIVTSPTPLSLIWWRCAAMEVDINNANVRDKEVASSDESECVMSKADDTGTGSWLCRNTYK